MAELGCLFTPVLKKTGKRIRMMLSIEDDKKIGRGGPWTAEVTDLNTGYRYRAWEKSCGIASCMCDAYAERIK
jgi:hypothetical protein